MSSFDDELALLSDIPAKPLAHKKLLRSIPTANPTKHLFWPDHLNERETSIVDFFANIGSGIDHRVKPKDRWYQYGANEETSFCFNAVNIAATRFSDGFAVWYASTDLETSKAEIIYHLRRQAAIDFQGVQQEGSILFQRAVCEAHIEIKGVDLTKCIRSSPSLLENGPPYPFCSRVGRVYFDKMYEGVIFTSIRYAGGINYAVFRQSCIKSSAVKYYFDVEVSKDGAVKVCNEEYP